MARNRAWKLLVAVATAVATATATIGGSVAAAAEGEAPWDSAPASSAQASPTQVLPERASSVAGAIRPLQLGQDFESVYDLEAPPAPDAGVNEGGVLFDFTVRYLTDYVFRGIDRSEGNGGFNDAKGNPVVFNPDDPNFQPGAEDAGNLQFDGKIKFDLGRVPSPFVGLFANVYNDDPINRFQEIRPAVGVEWMIRPLIIAGGNTTFIYPERDAVNTAEVWASVTLDDSFLFGAEQPVFSPYAFASYDYDLYSGLYIEGGIKHEFVFEDTPFTLTAVADVAFVASNPQFTAANGEDTGFQHWDVGLIGRYNLNTLFNVSRRYGTFHLEGYLYYTDGIADDLLADTQLWGGVGIGFKY